MRAMSRGDGAPGIPSTPYIAAGVRRKHFVLY
jgi:hypothetical protein